MCPGPARGRNQRGEAARVGLGSRGHEPAAVRLEELLGVREVLTAVRLASRHLFRSEVLLRDLLPREQDVDADERLGADAALAHRLGLGQPHPDALQPPGAMGRVPQQAGERFRDLLAVDQDLRQVGRGFDGQCLRVARLALEAARGLPDQVHWRAVAEGQPGPAPSSLDRVRLIPLGMGGFHVGHGGARLLFGLRLLRGRLLRRRHFLPLESRREVAEQEDEADLGPQLLGDRHDRHSDVEARAPRRDQREVEARLRVPGRRFHGLPDLRVVAEDLDHRPAHAVGQAHPQGVQSSLVGEGDDALRVGCDEAGHQSVQDGFDEAAPLLHPGQGRLELAGALGRELLEVGRGELPRPHALGNVGLDRHEVGDPADVVGEGCGGEVVPEGGAVLAVVLQEHAGGPARAERVSELGQGGHVGRGPAQHPEALAEELLGRIGRHPEEGGVRVGDRILGGPRIHDGDSGARRLEGAGHEAEPVLALLPAQHDLHPLPDERGVEGLGQDLVRPLGEGELDGALGAQAHDRDEGLADRGKGADARADGDAVERREEGVEQDEVQLEPARQGEGLDAVRGFHHLHRAHVEGLAE